MTPIASRPRVLHVVHSLEVGGMQLNLEHLTRGTNDRFEHHVCCVREGGAIAAMLEQHGTTVHDLHFSGRGPLASLSRMRALMRALRPAVVHARNWGTYEAIPAARLSGVAGTVFSEHRDPARPRVPRYEWGRWLLAPWVDAFVTPTPYIAGFLVDLVGISARKVQVIANGVDLHRYRPRPDRDALRAARGFAPESQILMISGRLVPVKRHQCLVDSVASLAKTRSDLHLVIVGDGPLRSALERQIEAYKLNRRVTITGMRSDVEEWLACSDLFVHPSLAEGASNAVLQALASGVPVVATDIEGHRDLVNSGINGQLVPLDDADALTRAIATYLDDAERRRSHGVAARRAVAEKFPLRDMIDRYAELYHRLALGRG